MDKIISPLAIAKIATLSLAAAALAGTGFYGYTLHRQNASLQGEIQGLNQSFENAQEDYNRKKTQLREAIDKLIEENKALKTELLKIRQERDEFLEEKTYLEEILVNNTKEMEQFRGKRKSGYADRVAELETALQKKDDELRQLSDRNKILSKRIKKLYELANQRLSMIGDAKNNLNKMIKETKSIMDSEWNTVNLGSVTVREKPRLFQFQSESSHETPETVKEPAPQDPVKETGKAKGRVLATNDEHGFVVVDFGRADGVRENTVFTLLKNGKEAGVLKVLEIRDVMTACKIADLHKGTTIEINDIVSIKR